MTRQLPEPPAEPPAGPPPESQPDPRFIGEARRELDAAIVGGYVTDRKSIRTLAAELGVSYGYVHGVLTEARVKFRRTGPDPSANTARRAFDKLVIARYKKGESMRAIAADVGRSYTTVRRVLVAPGSGVTIRSRKRAAKAKPKRQQRGSEQT